MLSTYLSILDPGFLKRRYVNDDHFFQMLLSYDPSALCPDCKVLRTPRSRHCYQCNKCVDRFDHHCPWINNCVGIKNHNAFLAFLISIWAKIVFHLIVDSFSLF